MARRGAEESFWAKMQLFFICLFDGRSFSLDRTLFLYEYLRNTNENLYADYAKIIKVHWMDDIPALRKRQ